tara:strand:- start:815 stop:1573 length:759 start_codon:yes stop_codon:yes gene_type:complete
MVFSRGLVISLGVSALSATLLFLYFRNRMSNVERKVDLMFDLIQSHENDRKQMAQHEIMTAQNKPVSQNTGAWANEVQSERNLIDVSDDEEEYDSEDSKEVSDDDEDLEERIKLVTTDIDLDEEEQTKNIVVLEANTNQAVIIDNTVELEEVTDNIDENQASSADNETNVQPTDNDNEPVEVDENDSLEDDDSDEEEEEEEEEENVVQEVSNTMQYNKLKVTELKAIAEAKGLTNYKSLKKQPLIDLIRASE